MVGEEKLGVISTKYVRWNEDSEYCPWGHPRRMCEREVVRNDYHKNTEARTYITHECVIHAYDMSIVKKARAAHKAGVAYHPKPPTPELQIIMEEVGALVSPTAELGPFQIHFKLICGHVMYSRGTSFIGSDLEEWYCYRCGDFCEVLTYNQVMQANVELTPLSRRHKLKRIEKEGLPESPPSSAAVIPDRWAGIDPAVVARNNMATHGGANSAPRPTFRGKKVS